MNTVIGRNAEIAVLKEALNSRNPELIALYGRRRVGKTYLVHALPSAQKATSIIWAVFKTR